MKFLKFRQGCLYGQYKIPREDFIGIELEFPCFEEQQKISEFIKALDEKINITETKLSEWELAKRGLIQQLFPN